MVLPPQVGELLHGAIAQQDAPRHVHPLVRAEPEGVADALGHQELRQQVVADLQDPPRGRVEPVGPLVGGRPHAIPVEVEEVHLPGHRALPPHMPVALGQVEPPDLLQTPPPQIPQGEEPGLPGLREEVEPPARAAVEGEIPRSEP